MLRNPSLFQDVVERRLANGQRLKEKYNESITADVVQ